MTKLSAQVLNVIEEIRDTMNALDEEIGALREQLRSRCNLDQGEVYELPRVKKRKNANDLQDDLPEYEREVGTPTFIPIEKVFSGKEAEDKGLHAFSDFYGDGNESTRFVMKMPGALIYHTDQPELIEAQILQVNALKVQMETLIQSLGNRDAKFEIMHRLYHMIITTHVTRLIHYSTTLLQSASFTWGGSPAVTEKTKEQILEMLKVVGQKKVLIDNPNVINWQQQVELDTVRVQSLPADTHFMVRRSSARVRPLCNLRSLEGQKIPPKPAHLPLIIINPSSVCRLNPLKDYNLVNRIKRKQRANSILGDGPLISYLDVYLQDPTKKNKAKLELAKQKKEQQATN